MNEFQKAQNARILSCYGETPDSILEKGGKSAQVGETRTWSGKNYKKQANGKWLEVSDRKMTKKEHEAEHEEETKPNPKDSYYDKEYKQYKRANVAVRGGGLGSSF